MNTAKKPRSGAGRTLPLDLRTCLTPRALLRLCLEAVEQVAPGERDQARKRLSGKRPEMMITLLTYAHAASMGGSEDIERAARMDPMARYICAGDFPDRQTIRRFRRQNRDLLRACLLHVFKQTWAFHFESGDADYVGHEWFESELIESLTVAAAGRLNESAWIDGAEADD